MKTKEELSNIKAEYDALSKKLAELTETELAEVTGGVSMKQKILPNVMPITENGLQNSDLLQQTSLSDKPGKTIGISDLG